MLNICMYVCVCVRLQQHEESKEKKSMHMSIEQSGCMTIERSGACARTHSRQCAGEA